MKDDTSRAPDAKAKVARNRRKIRDFENVEFIGNALDDPKNVLRFKLKELTNLRKDQNVRRVIIITDLVSEDERDIRIIWSGRPGESEADAEDSVMSLLTRAMNIEW